MNYKIVILLTVLIYLYMGHRFAKQRKISQLMTAVTLMYHNLRILLPFFLGDAETLESVPDLVKAMYINVESFPCVRLLNHSGQVGCSSEYSVYSYSVCLN